MIHIGRVGSVFVTIAITIERYVSTGNPTTEFKGKSYLVLLPIISAILYNIPKFFEIEAIGFSNSTSGTNKSLEQGISIETSPADSNASEKIIIENIGYRATPLRLNYWYVILYVTWSKLLLVEIFPWITVICLNVLIWKRIRRFRVMRMNVFQKQNGKKFRIILDDV